MLYCLNDRKTRTESNSKVLTFMWVWKSLKSVLLSPVQRSDSGHTVAHDCCCWCCWSPDVALRASGSNNSALSCLSWSIMSVTSRVWTDYRSTRFSLLDELSLKIISCPNAPKLQVGRRAFALWENAQKGTGGGLQWTKSDDLNRSAQKRFDSLTFLPSDICFVILFWWVFDARRYRGFNAHLSRLLLLQMRSNILPQTSA